jgi:hypothetical protein
MRYRARTPLGEVDAAVYYRSHVEVDGVMVADAIVQDVAGQQTEMRLRTIELR